MLVDNVIWPEKGVRFPLILFPWNSQVHARTGPTDCTKADIALSTPLFSALRGRNYSPEQEKRAAAIAQIASGET